jgi:2-polyprenyl-3-methyl-5-hydroxy-6-metoxy-1,4-benzoquinol methylase
VTQPEGTHSADTDLDLVLAEIHAEAARLRAERRGGIEPELDAAFRRHTPPDLDAADSTEVFAQLDALAAVSIPVPDSAPRPGRPEWKRTVLRAIGKVLRAEPVARLIRMATSEITAFNAASVRVLRRFDTRLARLEVQAVGASPAVNAAAEQAMPAPLADAVVAAAVAAIGAPGGRVLHAGCARGELVRSLTDAGVSAYGVDTRRALHVGGLRDGLDLRGDDPAAHLAALPPHSLGAVVLDGTLDHRPVAEQVAMLEDAAGAVAPGGRIVVVLSERSGPGAVAADLAGGRALLPATWEHLLALRTSPVHTSETEGVVVIVGDVGP